MPLVPGENLRNNDLAREAATIIDTCVSCGQCMVNCPPFRLLAEWFGNGSYRGCAFINSVGELGETLPEVLDITRCHKQDMADAIGKLLPASRQRKRQAMDLALAVDGAIIRAQFDQDPEAALASLERIRKALLGPGAQQSTVRGAASTAVNVSSKSSIQCFTGSGDTSARCGRQPMLAVTMIAMFRWFVLACPGRQTRRPNSANVTGRLRAPFGESPHILALHY